MLCDLTSALLFLTLVAFCAGEHWLMEGDFISPDEAKERHLNLESTNSTTSVSSYLRLTLSTAPNHKIHCIMAAALHMNGHVSILDGGIDKTSVTLAYETIKGETDLFFTLIESHAKDDDEIVRLKDNIALNSRVTILYDRLKDWKSMIDFGDDYVKGVTDANERATRANDDH